MIHVDFQEDELRAALAVVETTVSSGEGGGAMRRAEFALDVALLEHEGKPAPSRKTVILSDEEIDLIGKALDSYEYWEHRDELPHDSGHITILDDEDFNRQLGTLDDDEAESVREAWEAVKAARALEDKLAQLIRPGV